MGNPLMQFMGNNMGASPNPLGNITQILQQFNQFRSSFKGDPKQQVEMLRKSGQMSDEQFKQLEAIANQILPFLK